MKSTVTSRAYILKLSSELWDALTYIEDYGDDRDLKVIEDLEKIGAYDIDWSGHFGRAIFFSVEATEATEATILGVESYVSKLTVPEGARL